jgi:hypothetical protein
MARPSSYTPEIAAKICDRMIEGESLLKICAENGMPDRTTIYRWLEGRNEFRDRYARAREAQAHYYFELIRDIAFDDDGDFFIENGKMVADHARVQRARLKVDALKWTSSKLLPRIYGDKPAPEAERAEPLVISWIERTIVDPKPPEPPRQLEYHKPQLPGDLSETDWSVMLELLELVKRLVPTNGNHLPAEIFGVMREALLAHFREQAEGVSA